MSNDFSQHLEVWLDMCMQHTLASSRWNRILLWQAQFIRKCISNHTTTNAVVVKLTYDQRSSSLSFHKHGYSSLILVINDSPWPRWYRHALKLWSGWWSLSQCRSYPQLSPRMHAGDKRQRRRTGRMRRRPNSDISGVETSGTAKCFSADAGAHSSALDTGTKDT